MFDPQPKPQFHTYPLRISQLSKLNVQMSQIDQQIYQNKKQIEEMNKKFSNQQYQNTYANRLMQKNRILSLKKQQLQHINRMHQYHQYSQTQQKKIDSKMNKDLANQYKSQIEQNRRKKSQQKDMQRQRDRQMLEAHQQQIRRLQNQKQANRQNIAFNTNIENDKIQNYLKNTQLSNRSRDKSNFLQNYRKITEQPTDKDIAFSNFYQTNQNRQKQLQKIYKTATQPLNMNKINQMNQIQQKNRYQYLRNAQLKAVQLSQNRRLHKQGLKDYLQHQIGQKTNQQNQYKQSKNVQDLTRRNQQVNNDKYEIQAKQKSKLQQYLYSNELAKQYNQQVQTQRRNSQRSHQHSYLNASSDTLFGRKQINSPDSPKFGMMLGRQKNRSIHNPLTNPIPFSIGITNPYVLKEYQNRRASSSFKGSNLANLGDQSFRN